MKLAKAWQWLCWDTPGDPPYTIAARVLSYTKKRILFPNASLRAGEQFDPVTLKQRIELLNGEAVPFEDMGEWYTLRVPTEDDLRHIDNFPTNCFRLWWVKGE